MTPTETSLPGVLLFSPTVYRDPRGHFVDTFQSDWLAALPPGTELVRSARTMNRAVHTLRGMHAQHHLGKLVGVAAGRVHDVVLDLRPDSPTRGASTAVELSAEGGELLWVPPGCAHGFLTLEEDTVITYLLTAPYVPAHEVGVHWNDPDAAIAWPAEPSIVGARDQQLQPLSDALAAMAQRI